MSPTSEGNGSNGGPVIVAYQPAVGPRLRVVLWIVFGLVALLGANSLYLAAITFFESTTGQVYQNYFYQYMFLAHLALGLVLITPVVVFGLLHMRQARKRPNRHAVRMGYALFTTALVLLGTGLLLTRVGGFDLREPTARTTVYWLHVLTPLAAIWLYWLHRLAGPPIKWRIGAGWGALVGVIIVGMVLMHSQDPRKWNVVGPKEGEKYFFPALSRTATGEFIPREVMMMDNYCAKCHADVHSRWSDSVHRFASFNNPAYLASVRETRQVSLKLDGNVRAARFCAGCHDPVPFFSGAFDDPNFDDINHPTAKAGIGCSVCHSITNVNSPRGNGDYTIEEPIHYPFAFSDNAALQWINNQLVKAKPAMHKKTFLKPLHRTTEFCGTCHKVHLPEELNKYKFLRGQNHYDTFLLSGVSGHGIRSFYYPPKAQTNCNGCHMPLQASADFGAKYFDDSGKLTVHDHLFPSANTAIAHFREKPDVVKEHQKFLEGVMRVDVFGIREGGAIDGKLHAPIRPVMPVLKPGESYLLETVIRTMKMGHIFTQGTADSNEVWLDVTLRSDDRVIGRSGSMDELGRVDEWSHFVNVFMLDRDGNRIDRRNAQDIFIPLYNNQVPPGAGQTVHYGFRVPSDVTQPVTIEVKLQYRKFDWTYMNIVARAKTGLKPPPEGQPYVNDLPVTTLAVDSVTLPVEVSGSAVSAPAQEEPKHPVWQRWNDYGIGLLLKDKAQLRQAADAFEQVEKLNRYDGPLNLARVYYQEGRLDEAVEAINRAVKHPDAPSWTVAWLTGLINRQQGRLVEAESNFRSALFDDTEERRARGFDFSKDYEVLNELGLTLFERARQTRPLDADLAKQAIDIFLRTLKIDPENVTAHYNLALLYAQTDETGLAMEHERLHGKFKPDDNARDRAVAIARKKYPAANHAAERVVIYDLQRPADPAAAERFTGLGR